MNAIELLKATKRSVIDGKWGHGYANQCVLWHAKSVSGKRFPLSDAMVGKHSLLNILDAECGGNLFTYNDTHSKWDMVALLGKFIRHLEAESARSFSANYTQQETNDV